MERRVKHRMDVEASSGPPELLGLPDAAILEVLRHLDGRSLVMLQHTASYFNQRHPVTSLPLAEHIARESLLRECRSSAEAERFRRRSWPERLSLEMDASCGFDRQHCEAAGFKFSFSPDGQTMRGVRLTGMGPKLLVSDATTRSQPVLRWQLRVKGNTAVEFGVIPAALEPVHTALHKCLSVPDDPRECAMGFCSQITAGSLLPLKAPVMRGTVLDVLARRGHVEVILRYPQDAREISWHNGQPMHKPYHGPSELRLEQDFPDCFDVRLAVTSWAKGSFEVLHGGFAFDPAWAEECCVAEAAEAAAEAASAAAEEAGGSGPAGPEAAALVVLPLLMPPIPGAVAAAVQVQPAAVQPAAAAAVIPVLPAIQMPQSPFALLAATAASAAVAGVGPGDGAGAAAVGMALAGPDPKEEVQAGAGAAADEDEMAAAMDARPGAASPAQAVAVAAAAAAQQLLLPPPTVPPRRSLSRDGHAVHQGGGEAHCG